MFNLRLFKNILKFNFAQTPKPLLGRWNLDKSEIKTDLANHDCCGDELCGDPRLTTLYIAKNISESKKNIN